MSQELRMNKYRIYGFYCTSRTFEVMVTLHAFLIKIHKSNKFAFNFETVIGKPQNQRLYDRGKTHKEHK